MKTEQSIMDLKGIGEKNAALFHKLNIETIDDLLHHFPREYQMYPKAECLRGGTKESGKRAVMATVKTSPSVLRARGTSMLKFQAVDLNGQSVWVSFFHMPYLKNSIKPGKTYIFYGSVHYKNQLAYMSHPKMFSPEDYQKLEGVLMPVYARTKGLTDQTIHKHCLNALKQTDEWEEYLPDEICKKNAFLPVEENLNTTASHPVEETGTLLNSTSKIA